MDVKTILLPYDKEYNNVTDAPYRQFIVCVMNLMLCTRPNIAYAVGMLSKFSSSPAHKRWASSKRLLSYLQATIDTKLTFLASRNVDLVAYSDADWASSHDRKSTARFLIYVGGNIVSWSTKK